MTPAKHVEGNLEYVPSTEHHGPYLTTQHGTTVADLYVMSQPSELSTANGGPSKPLPFLHEMADPNAARLALCWNMHDRLVAVLRDAATVLKVSGSSPLGKTVNDIAAILAEIEGAK